MLGNREAQHAVPESSAVPSALGSSLLIARHFGTAFLRLRTWPSTAGLQRARELRRLLDGEVSRGILDAHLAGFRSWRASAGRPAPRRWRSVDLAAIGSDQVTGISIDTMVAMLQVAVEIEAPIDAYSRRAAEALEGLLPSLAAFVGEPAAERCRGTWCIEERRHAPVLARAAEALGGRPGGPERPQVVVPVRGANRAERMHQLARREATELGASSAYLMMAVHARGELRHALLEILRDEIKHFALMRAAHVHLEGYRPLSQFLQLACISTQFVAHHARSRSSGRLFGSQARLGLSTLTLRAALGLERRVDSWLKILSRADLSEAFGAACP